MKRISPLITLFLAVSLFSSCGDSPSGPDNTPTPSVLSVEFTGEGKTFRQDGTLLQMTAREENTTGRGDLGTSASCQITATWTICPDGSFQSYVLYRSTTPNISDNPESAEVLVVYTDANQRTYVDEAVDWDTIYYYAVRTGNTDDKYSWSNEAEISTPEGGGGGSQDGSIVAWGMNSHGQCDVPSPNNGFVAVAAGDSHSLGLKADGYILAWGNNYYGQCVVPSPNSGFVAVASGDRHSLGLKADGSIVAWGLNTSGQCNVPSPNSGFIAVAGGYNHSLGIKADSTIVAWGLNDFGQCTVPSPNSGFMSVTGGNHHSLGIRQ